MAAVGIDNTPGVDTTAKTSNPTTTLEKDEIHANVSGTARQVAQVFNGYDPHLLEHEHHIMKITWFATDAPGKVLKVFSMAPDLHPVMRYLGKLYQYWSGSFTLIFRIFATGVNAGALRISTAPPTMDEDELINASMAKLAYLPAMTLDARNANEHTIAFKDMNEKNIHRFDDGVFGSHIVLWVYATLQAELLNTVGVTVDVQILPNPDFKMWYLLPRNLETVATGNDAYNDSWNMSLGQRGAYGTITNITIRDKSYVKPVLGWFLHRNVYGDLDGTGLPDYAVLSSAAQAGGPRTAYIGGPGTVWGYNMAIHNQLPPAEEYFLIDTVNNEIYKTSSVFKPSGKGGYGAKFTNDIPKDVQGTICVSKPAVNDAYPEVTFQPYDNESIIEFSQGKLVNLIPQSVIDRWAHHPMDIPPGYAAQYNMVNVTTGAPVRVCKLYPQGIMTTSGSTEEVVYPIEYRFEYVRLMAASEHLPRSATYMMNDMLHLREHRRAVRHHA